MYARFGDVVLIVPPVVINEENSIPAVAWSLSLFTNSCYITALPFILCSDMMNVIGRGAGDSWAAITLLASRPRDC